MTVERLAPNGVTLTNLTGNLSDITNDPDDSVDTTWLVATGNNVGTTAACTFPTPTANMTAGADLQEIRARVRKFSATQTGTPTARIDLYENGSLISTGTAVNVTDAVGQVISRTFNSTLFTDATGAGVEARVVGIQTGGSPAVRNTVDVGAVEWNADYTVGTNHSQTKNDPLGLTDSHLLNLAMLVEDFEDASFGDTEFEIRTAQTGATTSLNAGRLRLQNDVTSNLSDELVSKQRFDVRESHVIFEAPTSPYLVAGTYNLLTVALWGDGLIAEVLAEWYSESSPPLEQFTTKIGANAATDHALSAADTRWVRIRLSGTDYFIDTSPDRLTWTQRATNGANMSFARSVEVRINASSDVATIWHLDNFNVVVVTPTVNDALGFTDGVTVEEIQGEAYERTVTRRTSGTLVVI